MGLDDGPHTPMNNMSETYPPVKGHETWTVRSALEWASSVLSRSGIDEAGLNAELLLAHLLRLTRTRLSVEARRNLDPSLLEAYRVLVERRLSREPLQYIIGEVEFMGLPLYVDNSVLIPRPETEILVEKSLELIRSLSKERVSVLDIGTGSGNIAIALAKFSPCVQVTTIDISREALRTAARNLQRLQVERVVLSQADLFSDFLPGQSFDVIVSNPPYVSAVEFELLQPEIRLFEPRIATTDEGDGLSCIKRILTLAQQKLERSGAILLELGYGQAKDATEIASKCGLVKIAVHDDLSGVPRVLEAWRRDLQPLTNM